MVGIYGLQNKLKPEMWYVGQSADIVKRWNKAYRNANCKNQQKLYYALKKYGYDNFEKVVIEECDNVDWILDYREMYWIRRLDTVNRGYNIKSGGHRKSWSDESHEKIRKSLRGKPKSQSSIEKAKATFLRNGHSYSHPHSEETKQRLREMSIGRTASLETRLKMGRSHAKVGEAPKHSDETKKHLREKAIQQFSSDEARQRVREQTALRWKDPIFRQKVIDGMKRSQQQKM
jgi:group I intron endonuclease